MTETLFLIKPNNHLLVISFIRFGVIERKELLLETSFDHLNCQNLMRLEFLGHLCHLIHLCWNVAIKVI